MIYMYLSRQNSLKSGLAGDKLVSAVEGEVFGGTRSTTKVG